MSEHALDLFELEAIARMESLLDQIDYQEKYRNECISNAIKTDKELIHQKSTLDEYILAYEKLFGKSPILAVKDVNKHSYGTLTISGNIEVKSASGFQTITNPTDSNISYDWSVAHGFTKK